MSGIFSLLALLYFVVVVVGVGWAFYLAYLATRALRKYLDN